MKKFAITAAAIATLFSGAAMAATPGAPQDQRGPTSTMEQRSAEPQSGQRGPTPEARQRAPGSQMGERHEVRKFANKDECRHHEGRKHGRDDHKRFSFDERRGDRFEGRDGPMRR